MSGAAPFNVFKIENLQECGQTGVALVPVRITTWLEFTPQNEMRIREFVRDAINDKLRDIRDSQD